MGMCHICGIRIKLHGRPARRKNLLMVANHASYLDILALGSRVKADFVAKDDVKSWPLVGIIARMGNTVFINRNRMRASGELSMLAREMARRKIPVIIFPEGTSSDGNSVLPFKSSLFSILEDADGKLCDTITVQPVSIAYVSGRGRRLDRDTRRIYTWALEDTRSMAAHLWDVLRHAPLAIEITLHEPVDTDLCADRKELALKSREAVNAGFNHMIGGENA
jgi:1-acyl-sn-glycerol-3-phosphate acyltransferase